MSEPIDGKLLADLHAYVDNQLDPAQRSAIEERLAADPTLARMAAAYAKQNAALHAVFDPVLGAPVPSALKRPPAPRWPRRLQQAAAAALLLAIGAAGGWWSGQYAQNATSARGVAERAAVAYTTFAPEVRHPVEVAAAQQDHLIAWLSKRLGTPVKAPVLTSVGFNLVGGRLLPDTATPAAQFMYEDKQGRRLTLYVRIDGQRAEKTAFRWTTLSRVEVCYWIDGPVAYAVAGELSREEMQPVARMIYQQVDG